MSDGNEVELKLEIDPADTARLIDHPLVKRVEPRRARQVSTYYDSGKGALRAAGYSLRLRRTGDRVVRGTPHHIVPVYVRRPDAELARERRKGRA